MNVSQREFVKSAFTNKDRVPVNKLQKNVMRCFVLRQNDAPAGLEKRGLDASINHKTRKPTEGSKSVLLQSSVF
ncbi:hypothetical protein C4Q31_02545 [Leptospira borgpetersenii serovar Ceylonica]|nr:hypothetical protein C4Q31_02545 [Leptospira borgpetersenii serovar Ceylonica]OOV44905.1 hypothetical protein B1H38_07590 [Leptospira borgpetersenii serovar Ballum]